ncbi:MAG: cobalamin biosynthesis protein, partial [Desulfovibrio sp.]|nr:cobalamin biosynthesis protein [Desulfovibrio sp.]
MTADLAGLLVLPLALLLDRLLSEPPERIHPVVWMGGLAVRAERFLRFCYACPARLPQEAPAAGAAARRERTAGMLAGLAVACPWTLGAWMLGRLAGGLGAGAGMLAASLCAWLCMAPESLARHALR